MNRQTLISALLAYSPSPDEHPFVARFLDLLQHPDAYQRTHLPGHLTGSVWIVDPSRKFVLLTHHAKLNRWLQPGGHADGDENILNVALREAEEETGLRNFTHHASVFDVDIHTIPARKDFPEHLHYDVRFLLETDRDNSLHLSDESHALAWVAVEELAAKTENNVSMLRMADKVKRLL
ncbi:NUDIX hydrolase [Chryseolinea lacunae]|uniref:NUDIX hydrolase n=1 Tax=Chryseolinea lacunae TaxID=2801331 RepID=UPI0034E1FB9B